VAITNGDINVFQLLRYLLCKEYEDEFPSKFQGTFRMSKAAFYKLLGKVEPLIAKRDTQMRLAIPAKVRLQVTLKYFALGVNSRTLEEIFRIPVNTISGIIAETASAIWTVLMPDYLQCPRSPEEWLQVAKGFGTKWQYPLAIGAVDGKHCVVQCFANSASVYYNYKGTYSIVLLAACDANMKFVFVNLGQPGSRNAAGIWADSRLKELIDEDRLGLPRTPEGKIDYHFVADDAFPIKNAYVKAFSSQVQADSGSKGGRAAMIGSHENRNQKSQISKKLQVDQRAKLNQPWSLVC
jgi:hypothetical protein